MNHAYRYTIMTHISKTSLFILSLFLILLVFSWPYITNSSHYNIRDVEDDFIESSVSPESDTARTPPATEPQVKESQASVPDMRDGSMVFRGHTQVVITPEPKHS